MNIDTHLMELIAQKASSVFGSHILPEQYADLYCRLKLRATELHKADVSCWLQQAAYSDWSQPLQQELLPVFSVGESYFGRDPLVTQWLITHWLGAKPGKTAGQLRIWSAGCCRGEEPYSLLFSFAEALAATGLSCDLTVLATDLNPEFIRTAQQGIYRASAFRNTSDTFKQSYFVELNEQHCWQVQAKWRCLISFKVLNLIDQQWPATAPYDLIFCRNVLMYFSPEQAEQVIRRFLLQLAPEGLLLLNAVEASVATQAGFDGFWAGENYALTAGALQGSTKNLPDSPQWAPKEQRSLGQYTATTQLPADTAIKSGLKLRAVTPRQATKTVSATGLHPALLFPPQQAEYYLQQARSAADSQQFARAQLLLTQLLKLAPTTVAAYILSAQLYIQQQQPQLALQALQKAIYLEPDLIVAHLLKANLAMDAGQHRSALKELELCSRLLQQCPATMEVPYSDHLSAGQLYVICQQLTAEAWS